MFPFPCIPHHLCLWQGLSKIPLHRYMGTEELQVHFSLPFWPFFSLLAVFVTHPSLPQPWSWMLPPQHCTSTELTVLFPSRAGFGWTDGESKEREQHLKTPKCSGNSVSSAPGGSQLPVLHLAPRAATFGVRKPNVLQRVPAGAGTPSAHKTLSDISLWLSHGE